MYIVDAGPKGTSVPGSYFQGLMYICITGYSKCGMYCVTPVFFGGLLSFGRRRRRRSIGLVSCTAAGVSSSLSDPVLSTECKVKQDSCATAKMTVRFALHIGYSTQ